MKTTIQITPDLHKYLLSVSLRESPFLEQLRHETSTHVMSTMQISPEQGQFMALLVELMGVRKAIELGVFTGYSALAVALAMPPDGILIACDNNQEYTDIATRHWESAGVAHKIDLRLAPAMDTLDILIAQGEINTFDFAFIDADKRNYDNYYEKVLRLLRPGGLMLIDNVLWGGKVADITVQDNRTQAIRAFNTKVHQDERVSVSLVPIADGLTLAFKRY